MREVICSGEALSWELAALFHDRLRANLHNLYGPTEASWTLPLGVPGEIARDGADRPASGERPTSMCSTRR